MGIHDIFDQTLKIIAREYTEVFLRLAFPGLRVRLLGRVENVELALPIRPVDFVHRVEYEGEEYLLHIEFQLRHDEAVPRRLCGYYGALTEQFGMPVLTVVLYLQPRRSAVPEGYEVRLGDEVVNRFSYPVVRLWDYVDEIRSGKYRELAPLLLLLVSEEPERVLEEERALILGEQDPQKRRDLLALAVTIATRHFDSRYLWQFFTKEEVREMREATFIDELIRDKLEEQRAQMMAERELIMQQGIQQGIQQGVRQGVWQANYENVLDVLATRFNPPAAQYRQIERQLKRVTDAEQLRRLLITLASTDDLSAFEETLEETIAGEGEEGGEWAYTAAPAG